MIYNTAVELEDIEIELERAENLLHIFFEFSEDEANIKKYQTLEEQKQAAHIFTTRFHMFTSLVVSAFDIIDTERERINKISESLFEMRKEKT